MNQTQSTPSKASSRIFFWATVLWTLLAMGAHAYLLNEHYNLHFGTGEVSSLCNINETFNCSAVSASQYSEFLGVPMALWGGLANFVILLLTFSFAMSEDEKKPAARRNLLLTSGFVLATSIVMGSISGFILSKLCLFCMATYLLSILTFASIWLGFKAPASKITSAPKVGDFIPLVVMTVIAFFVGFIARDQIQKSYVQQDLGPIIQGLVSEWQSAPVTPIQLVEPLVEGATADKARMTIIEFADFRCIHCKHASPVLKAFVDSHPDVRLEFQPWPLDGECNTKIPSANGASCLLARAVLCAEEKGKAGWKAHAYIYGHELYPTLASVESALPEIAAAAGVNPQEFATCAQSDAAKETVRKQAAVGSALDLKGTPTFYVNGKFLSGGHMLPVLSAVYSATGK
jgi:protein-disulfide isomerase/uncharacterized membrane protein